MKVLIDTHVLIWWLGRSRRIPRATRDRLLDAGIEVRVSAATAWEIVVKRRIGKLAFDTDFLAAFDARVQKLGFDPMGVTARHAIRGAEIDSAHKDPFDRMLAGQALVEDLTLVSADPAFEMLGVKAQWWR